MRAGTAVRAHLLYPVYSGDALVLANDAVLLGTVVELKPDRTRRIHARLRADFTPFHTPVVRFTQVLLADGTTLPIASEDAASGAPIFRLVAPPPVTGGFLSRQFQMVRAAAKDRLQVITGPDKGDRLKQFLYSQLPYHPERIEKKTSWTVENTSPLEIAVRELPATPAAKEVATPPATDARPTWLVQAYLHGDLDSSRTKAGEVVRATVAEPIYNPDHSVAVPQGATLIGAVTRAKPARSFGRAGALSFSFRQLILPGEAPQSVQASLVGADSASSANLTMNSEGEVQPKPQDKLLVPFILLTLAARPLDRDHGDNAFGKDAVASNSLGLIGFIVGTVAQQRNLAAGLGYYGAAVALYERWLRHGKEVTFAKDTRLVVQTTARRSAALPTPGSVPALR